MHGFSRIKGRSDQDQHTWIDIYIQGGDPGILDAEILSELGHYLGLLQSQDTTGLVLRFISSPDTDSIDTENKTLTLPGSHEQSLLLISQIQRIAELIQDYTVPSVFILDGSCPVGGMALVLATDYCIAPLSQIAENFFTDNKVGLHPAPYVIKRLTDKVGSINAITAITSAQVGINLSHENYHKNNFVDAFVITEQLNNTAIKFINEKPGIKQTSLAERLLNNSLIRTSATAKLERLLHKEYPFNPQHYPAPYALLRLWKQFGSRTDQAVQSAYADSLIQLLATDSTAGLQRTNRLRHQLGTQTSSTQPLRHLHIIGSGHTSCLIASHCLLQGTKVSMGERRSEALEQAVGRISFMLSELLENQPAQQEALIKNLYRDPQGEQVRTADIILLAGFPSLSVQQNKFAELEEISRSDAILATQSSTIPLRDIATVLLNPERLLGIHFCFPVNSTPLVEVSYTTQTAVDLPARAISMLRSVNKLPLTINNTPGLLADRILVQYILRGIQLHQQGIPHVIIDSAAQAAGMPAGPLELADQMGLSYCLRIAEVLEKAYGVNIPYQLTKMVQAGKLGWRSGSGFYRYRNGKRLKPARVNWDGDINALQDKLIGQIIEEAALCLEDGVTDNPALVNATLIFGVGFAAWDGNPLHFTRKRPGDSRRTQ